MLPSVLLNQQYSCSLLDDLSTRQLDPSHQLGNFKRSSSTLRRKMLVSGNQGPKVALCAQSITQNHLWQDLCARLKYAKGVLFPQLYATCMASIVITWACRGQRTRLLNQLQWSCTKLDSTSKDISNRVRVWRTQYGSHLAKKEIYFRLLKYLKME